MLADDEIDIVLNITQPNAHTIVAQAAVDAGKSVYNEKAADACPRRGSKGYWKRPAANGLLVGCAPGHLSGCRAIKRPAS